MLLAVFAVMALTAPLISPYDPLFQNISASLTPPSNGYPLRLVVPGFYGTYWVKHIHEITVLDEPFNGYWNNPAYRIPDNSCACVEPGATPKRTVPISRCNVRSTLERLRNGDARRYRVTGNRDDRPVGLDHVEAHEMRDGFIAEVVAGAEDGGLLEGG